MVTASRIVHQGEGIGHHGEPFRSQGGRFDNRSIVEAAILFSDSGLGTLQLVEREYYRPLCEVVAPTKKV